MPFHERGSDPSRAAIFPGIVEIGYAFRRRSIIQRKHGNREGYPRGVIHSRLPVSEDDRDFTIVNSC